MRTESNSNQTDAATGIPHPEAALLSTWEARMNKISEKSQKPLEPAILKPTDQSARSRSMGRLILRDTLADRVSEIWGAILGIATPPRDRNFFELGGTSCKAVDLMASVRKEFHVEMGLRSLFEAPTIEGMCARIHRLQQSTPVA
jgi:acyl carrier protein